MGLLLVAGLDQLKFYYGAQASDLRFGKFLQQANPRLAFACFLNAERLLPKDATSQTDDLLAISAAIKSELSSTESALGTAAADAVSSDLNSVLQQALSEPPAVAGG